MADKGGLVFVPDSSAINVFENVAQMDFSQMYPTIMVNHNISPECVNCECCANDPDAPRVPETGIHICVKRNGIVPLALSHILKRRKYYKERIAELTRTHEDPAELERYEARQNSLKWMLVTSFGYLGFRNAKFGRLESHESVTAFGREILLRAKEISEDHGYALVHAITDCIFLTKQGATVSMEDIQALTKIIEADTGVQMSADGIYNWIIFLPSRQDPLLPVMNRYCGRFSNGSIKFRGVAARRKDTPAFLRTAQLAIIRIMQNATSVKELRALHSEVDKVIREFESKLRNREVPWKDLLLRKTASKELSQYKVHNSTYLAMKQIDGLMLPVQAGEKIRYIVINNTHPDKSKRVLSEETALEANSIQYDTTYYLFLLRDVFKEIWIYFAPKGYFDADPLYHNLFSVQNSTL